MIFSVQPRLCVNEIISLVHPGQNKVMPSSSNTKNVAEEGFFCLSPSFGDSKGLTLPQTSSAVWCVLLESSRSTDKELKQ